VSLSCTSTSYYHAAFVTDTPATVSLATNTVTSKNSHQFDSCLNSVSVKFENSGLFHMRYGLSQHSVNPGRLLFEEGFHQTMRCFFHWINADAREILTPGDFILPAYFWTEQVASLTDTFPLADFVHSRSSGFNITGETILIGPFKLGDASIFFSQRPRKPRSFLCNYW